MRPILLLSWLAACGVSAPQPAPPIAEAPIVDAAVPREAEADAEAPIVDAGSDGREEACAKATADFQIAAVPAFDTCTHGKRKFGPIGIDSIIDPSGHIQSTQWSSMSTTAWGPRTAHCIIVKVKAVPFASMACANTTVHIERAYPHDGN